MKQFFAKPIIYFLALTFSCQALAFDTETHALITRKAWERSVLFQSPSGDVSPTIRALGLDRLNIATPFNYYWVPLDLDRQTRNPTYYTDGSGLYSVTSKQQYPEPFERCQMQEFLKIPPTPPKFQIFGNTVDSGSPFSTSDTFLPIQNWLIRGAIREDDLGASELFYLFSHDGINCFGYLLSSAGESVAIRSLSHFYDPYLDLPLPVQQVVINSLGVTVTFAGHKAIDWALGYQNVYTGSAINPDRGNFYSYADARNMYWWALTRQSSKGAPYTSFEREQDAEDKLSLWATTFRSLGDVVHLLEDGGQPQHTRNDPHSKFNTPEQKAFEDYTNDRVLGVNTEVNSHLRAFFDTLPPAFTPPSLGDYDPVNFSTPLRFFTTRSADGSDDQQLRAGLSDYSNRGFFTGGTHPSVGTMAEPNPPAPFDVNGSLINGFQAESAPCRGLLNADARLASSVVCQHFTHDVPDRVFTEFNDELCDAQNPARCFSHPPLASDAVLHRVIVEAQSELQGTISDYYQYETAIGIEEMDITGNMTIPRAVAYSAGMLNFFFRGSLQVTAPDDGIYAVINHGTPHTVLPGGIPVKSDGVTTFGFEKVRLNVKNITMADGNGTHVLTESGTGNRVDQTLSATVAGDIRDPQITGPYLVAIARYHRNTCYQRDLSGEAAQDVNGTNIPATNCDPATMRSAWPEISVSKSVAVGAGALDGTQPQLIMFDFSSDPIPVNATDIFFQVAYRGPIGAEQDGIAVGIVDVSEPTYYSVFNNTDYVLDQFTNIWRYATSSEPPPIPLTYLEICSADGAGNKWQIYRDNNFETWQDTSQPLPAAHLVRVAMLLKPNATLTFSTDGVGIDQYGGPFFDDWATPIQVVGKQRQASDERGTGFNPQPFNSRRGIVMGDYVTRMTHSYVGESGTHYTLLNPWPTDNSYWSGTPQIQPLNSEDIGDVIVPGTVSCRF